MNREIKFRGKRYKHGGSGDDWVYGDFYHSTDGSACIGEWRVKEKTVGQYIGRKAKNEVEIYDDDFVKTDGRIRLVKWGFISADSEAMGYAVYDLDEDTEVVGNIHENPELLK